MFNNDSYIRKFPMYESSLLVDLRVESDRDENRESLVSWFKRVFISK